MDTFALLKYLTQFGMPPASMAVGLMLAAILAVTGWRRLGALVAALAIAQTLVMAFPPVSDALLEPLQAKARAAAAEAPHCCYEAIVVLGRGMTPAWRAPGRVRPSWDNWIPSTAAMAWSSISLPEHVGLLLDRRGGI